jgi:hypothetical protein
MNRRQFLEAVAVGRVAAPALGSLRPGKLPKRPLGRTGLQVPILAFGSGSRFQRKLAMRQFFCGHADV